MAFNTHQSFLSALSCVCFPLSHGGPGLVVSMGDASGCVLAGLHPSDILFCFHCREQNSVCYFTQYLNNLAWRFLKQCLHMKNYLCLYGWYWSYLHSNSHVPNCLIAHYARIILVNEGTFLICMLSWERNSTIIP